MLPTIRPIRHPLLPADQPETASVGHRSAGVSPASSRSVPAPSPAPSEPAPPPKTENRSDFGQKRTDSLPQSPESDPPSTLSSQRVWSLQPNEPAADYQLFAAWLQIPPPRRFTTTAAMLGCSLHRLRRLSARHHWKPRAAAFDRHRASAASLALDQLLRNETSDWKERVERFRLQEWLLHEEMLQAASEAVRQLRKHPGRASLSDIARLFDLASVLGRRACGMPLDPPAAAKFDPPFSRPDVEAALQKIYGQSEPWTGLVSGAH
jgi:hypothetical protein